MARGVPAWCGAALLLHLTCVAATVQMLGDINDLKRLQLQHSVPRHGLKLLHWFANQVDMHSHGIRLNFNPNSDYGSHHYVNSDGLLPYRSSGYQYYTVGNLNTDMAARLPDYVRYQQHDEGYNRARIIFRVNRQTIDRVYLSQHYSNNRDSSYDPYHTYEISANLLTELRQVPRGDLEQFFRHDHHQRLQHSPFRNVPAVAEPRQGAGFVFNALKWVLIILLMIVLVAIFTELYFKMTKSPFRY